MRISGSLALNAFKNANKDCLTDHFNPLPPSSSIPSFINTFLPVPLFSARVRGNDVCPSLPLCPVRVRPSVRLICCFSVPLSSSHLICIRTIPIRGPILVQKFASLKGPLNILVIGFVKKFSNERERSKEHSKEQNFCTRIGPSFICKS